MFVYYVEPHEIADVWLFLAYRTITWFSLIYPQSYSCNFKAHGIRLTHRCHVCDMPVLVVDLKKNFLDD